MPLLDKKDFEAMLARRHHCSLCANTTGENYCRQCDEFFDTGHAPTCPLNASFEKHKKHRNYLDGGPVL